MIQPEAVGAGRVGVNAFRPGATQTGRAGRVCGNLRSPTKAPMRYARTYEAMSPDVPSPTAQGIEILGDYPKPPSLHWALVLLYYMLTFGIFGVIWTFRQAAWVRRLEPTCNAIFILVVAFALPLLLMFGGDEPSMRVLRLLGNLGSFMAFVWAYLLMRRAIEDRFELNISLIMTVFFPLFYLQYHLTRIARGEYALQGDVRF